MTFEKRSRRLDLAQFFAEGLVSLLELGFSRFVLVDLLLENTDLDARLVFLLLQCPLTWNETELVQVAKLTLASNSSICPLRSVS